MAAIGVFDEFDESVVAGFVDPAACRVRDRSESGAHREAGFPCLLFGESNGADLWVGERDARERSIWPHNARVVRAFWLYRNDGHRAPAWVVRARVEGYLIASLARYVRGSYSPDG
jgi:hypothetical protein